MQDLVEYSVHEGAAVLTVRNPPVNALSPGVPQGLLAGVSRAVSDPAVTAVVVIGGGATFIAGADIREFGKIVSGEKQRGRDLYPLLEALEDCPKPTVAAIHGAALGGGLELAQACHYRIAAPGAQLGQPEVKIGLIPGAGGTQRLPRLAGVAQAAEMCAFGEPIAAADALEAGIVDRLAGGGLLAAAVSFAREAAESGRPHPKTRERAEKLGDPDENRRALAELRARVAKKRKGFQAPLAALDAVEAAASLPFDEGLRREAEIFERCLYSEESAALIHLFFAERAARKIPGLPAAEPAPRIRQAAVTGAGTMGSGIAIVYALAGIPVLLHDVSDEALAKAQAAVRSHFQRSVKSGRLSPDEAAERSRLVRFVRSLDDFGEADIAVEAVFEDLELKKRTFAALEGIVRPDAILATNTSTLDVDAIAAATSRPQQVVGHHFFSPAPLMRLIEIVRGKETSSAVLAASLALARRLGKVAVPVGNCWGFAGNRLFAAYRREAQFLVEDGAQISEVDAALVDFGMAMGPLAVGDLAGLDVGWRIRQQRPGMFPDGLRRPFAEDRLCELGRFGRKTGSGWYRYDGGKPVEDPEAAKIVREAAVSHGIPQRTIGPEEIVDRCILALVNEGAKAIEEGCAFRAGDLDVIYVNGYGFPAWRGGPMWYADRTGLASILERLRRLEEAHGGWWRPARLLEDLAGSGGRFNDG